MSSRIITQSQRPKTKEIVDPSHPLLEINRSMVESIRKETFAYGSQERHKLDVYYPSLEENVEENKKYPCLVYFYGGGLVRGSRSSAPYHLVYNNVGAFFASRGILTVVPDYRLVPGITFPEGSEDVRDALQWVFQNLKERDPERLFILAHSAGGLHVSGLMLLPEYFATMAKDICGVIFMGVPFLASSGHVEFFSNALQYYGGQKDVDKNMPLPLLKQADKDYVSGLPPVWNLIAGSEPRAIANAVRAFTKEFASKGGKVEEFVLEGHDHSSPILALCSGYGAEWGESVTNLIRGTALSLEQDVHITASTTE